MWQHRGSAIENMQEKLLFVWGYFYLGKQYHEKPLSLSCIVLYLFIGYVQSRVYRVVVGDWKD